jgi:uncharacterized protein
MNRIILLHGKDKCPTDIWYQSFKQDCVEAGMVCDIPELPGGEVPVLSEWLAVLDSMKPDEDTILVGHSRGGMAILRWLETPDRKIRRVILVAANSANIKDRAKGDFYTGPYDFATIRSNCKDFVVLQSKDDQWVPYQAGLENADGLQAKLIIFEDMGHFTRKSDGSPMTEFPELAKEILR